MGVDGPDQKSPADVAYTSLIRTWLLPLALPQVIYIYNQMLGTISVLKCPIFVSYAIIDNLVGCAYQSHLDA